jgi:hypothetical protein
MAGTARSQPRLRRSPSRVNVSASGGDGSTRVPVSIEARRVDISNIGPMARSASATVNHLNAVIADAERLANGWPLKISAARCSELSIPTGRLPEVATCARSVPTDAGGKISLNRSIVARDR